MKEKWTPHIIAVNALVVFIVLGLACASAPKSELDNSESLQTDNPESDFKIDWDNSVKGGVVITGYTGTRKVVRIPASIQNNPVTSIGEGAFQGTNITNVIIPDSVKTIMDGRYFVSGAFSDCKNLTSVTIGSGVTSIGDCAFSNCTSLINVTIGSGVTSIGGNAFQGCVGLGSVTIPNSVKSIGVSAFSGCNNLTRVTIGSGVTSIGYKAFEGCTSLTSVTFATGSNIANLDFGYYAFPEGNIGDGGNTLKTAYSTGKAGTYKRTAGGSTWSKQ
jgi:hypothetical protein